MGEDQLDWLATDPNVVKQIDEAVAEYVRLNESFFSDLNKEHKRLVEEERKNRDADVEKIRSVRRQRRRKYLALPVFIFACGTIAYFLWGEEVPGTWLTLFVSNGTWLGLVWFASKVWDSTTKKIEEREKRHFLTAADIAKKLLQTNKSKFRWGFVDTKKDQIKAVIMTRLNQMLQQYVTEAVIKPNHDRYAAIKVSSSQIKQLANEYINASNTLTASLSGYYKSTDTNLSVLAEVSNVIRAEAIEPSFERLKKRNEKLQSLREHLAAIEPLAT